MTTADDLAAAALRLRAWAETIGVFAQGRPRVAAAPHPAAADIAPFAIGDADATFAAKPITAVGACGGDAPHLVVYTRRRLTRAEEQRLAVNLTGFPIAFRVARPFTVGGPATAADPTGLVRPRIRPGASVGVGNAREAGTLGAVVEDDAGRLFGLSCNHVTGGCSNARRDLAIVAPGITDVVAGGPDPVTIGHHVRALPLVPGDPSAGVDATQNLDAAIFRLTPRAARAARRRFTAAPAHTAPPPEGGLVEKHGRTTATTRGRVEARLAGPARLDYDLTIHHSAEESVVFRGSVFFDPVWIVRGLDGPFALPGDSGALVTSGPDAVGLVVGGNGDVTWMLPIESILTRLGVRLFGAGKGAER